MDTTLQQLRCELLDLATAAKAGTDEELLALLASWDQKRAAERETDASLKRPRAALSLPGAPNELGSDAVPLALLAVEFLTLNTPPGVIWTLEATVPDLSPWRPLPGGFHSRRLSPPDARRSTWTVSESFEVFDEGGVTLGVSGARREATAAEIAEHQRRQAARQSLNLARPVDDAASTPAEGPIEDHLPSCPQHPGEIATGWRHLPCDCRAHRAAMAFSALCPVGTPVRYWTGVREGEGRTGRTRSAAWVLPGGAAVVQVEGQAGCVALTHVERVEAQAPTGAASDVTSTTTTTEGQPCP